MSSWRLVDVGIGGALTGPTATNAGCIIVSAESTHNMTDLQTHLLIVLSLLTVHWIAGDDWPEFVRLLNPALQRGKSSCQGLPTSFSTRSHRNLLLEAGEYRLHMMLDQSLKLRSQGGCVGAEFMTSTTTLDGTLIDMKVLSTTDTCDRNSENDQMIVVAFTAPRDGEIQLTLETEGGSCASVRSYWHSMEVQWCSSPLKKLERKLASKKRYLDRQKKRLRTARADKVERYKRRVRKARDEIKSVEDEIVLAEECSNL